MTAYIPSVSKYVCTGEYLAAGLPIPSYESLFKSRAFDVVSSPSAPNGSEVPWSTVGSTPNNDSVKKFE